MFKQIWDRLETGARIGLVLCLTLLVGATIALSLWMARADYQVLFSDLAPADAAAMTAELDKMKIPYRLDGGGNTILVQAEDVYKTRLKLVGRDLPLHGTVGFELFNNADIGMTEFAQKVNYQRALQGELTRTILSYEEIQAARVHLALPEQTLFKKSGNQGKASVSLTLKAGKTLQPREVQGIQRLVAASVPDILEQDVTVIDQHGVALTRATGHDSESGELGSSNLDSKEELEKYLNRKVTDILDRTFGVGQAAVSVDVLLTRDAVKTTTENVLGADTGNTGVIVHEHQTGAVVGGDPASGASVAEAAPRPVPAGGNRDVDYQVGRRVEQIVSGPGAIDKISVAVVLHQQLDDSQIVRISDIISKAIGIDKSRGDGVAVYAMNELGNAPNLMTPLTATPPQAELATAQQTPSEPHVAKPIFNIVYALLGLIVVVVLAALFLLTRGASNPADSHLTAQEREELLARLRVWLDSKPGKQGDPA